MSTPDSAPVSATTLSEAMHDAHSGSAETLGKILEACRPYLLLIANTELDDDLQAKAGASDLVQQTFLEAQRDFGRFKGTTETELHAWLRQILRNNLANFRRDYRKLAKRKVARETSLHSGETGPSILKDLPSKDDSPSIHLLRQEQEEMLQRVLNRLPENYRQAIVLRQREQCSFEVIGERLNCSAEAARKLWMRGLERLQEELAHESDLP